MGSSSIKSKFSNWKKVLALTGGMGSGKSTVLSMLKKKGAFVLDADQIVHEILKGNRFVLRKIRLHFGGDIFDEQGQLVRRRLGQRVFNSPAEIKFLEKLLHPLVRWEMAQALKHKSGKVAVCDIPLLFETKQHRNFDGVIVVDATDENRRERLVKKGFSSADIERRFKAQIPLKKKVKQADFVVNNNGTEKQTQKQINQLWLSLKS